MTSRTDASRPARSGPRGTSNGTPFSVSVRLARTIRWATVGSGTRNARAISSVVSPPRSRRVRAARASVGRTGWQAVNMRRSRSSPMSSSRTVSRSGSASCCWAARRWPISACLRSINLDRRTRSIARCFAVAMSHAPGLSGTPDSGHCSRAATRASWASSSAAPTSRTIRASPAINRADSMRQTASMVRRMSVAVMPTDQTIFAVAVQGRLNLLLRLRLHVRQPRFEVLADHPVHVDEHLHHLEQERLATGHRPGDRCGVPATVQGELSGIVCRERLDEVESDHDPRRGRRFGDLHPPLADLLVSFPLIDGPLAVGRPAVGPLQVWVHLLPRGPGAPAGEVVDEREDPVGWGLDGAGPLDPERVRLRRGVDEDPNDHEGDHAEDDEDDGQDHARLRVRIASARMLYRAAGNRVPEHADRTHVTEPAATTNPHALHTPTRTSTQLSTPSTVVRARSSAASSGSGGIARPASAANSNPWATHRTARSADARAR